MRNRQPADQRMDPYVSRTGGTMARSPSERLEPTRPPARPRRRKDDREPRRSSPLLRFLNGLLTFVLLLMLVVGRRGLRVRQPDRCAGPLEQPKTVVIPKGEGTHEIASRLEREGIVTRSPAVHRGISLEQARGDGGGRQAGSAQGRRL